MKASVCMITYNQENYIGQAIESALMQKTDFDFEIVIGEDNSKDATLEIVKKYKGQHPDKIRPLLNGREISALNGRPKARCNLVNTIENASGDYIALLEGDDYWTSADKLQKQADFLDANPDCAMCFHSVNILYENRQPPEFVATIPKIKKEKYSLEDLLKDNFIHTCSVMFRRGLFGEFPDWFWKTAVGDWPLHVLNAQYGKIGYLDAIMGVYRIHGGGAWGPKDDLARMKKFVNMYGIVKANLDRRYEKTINASVRAWRFRIIEKSAGLLLARMGFNPVINFYRGLFYPESIKKKNVCNH